MKILSCGDSWTYGYGLNPNESWPNYLGSNIKNTSKCGSSNNHILDQFLDSYNNNYDLVIIGWSGVTRLWDDKFHDFSTVDQIAIDYYKNKTLDNILNKWDNQIQKVLKVSKVPVIQFSVFGDVPLKYYKNFIKISFLEFLANKQNVYFKYDIPIFEFDWLNENNLILTEEFGKKYFPKDWKKACVERENLRPSKYFLDCGHPNKEGQQLWGEFIKEKIDCIFN